MASLSLSEDSLVCSHLRERIANVHLKTNLSLKQVSLKQQEGCESQGENESNCKKAEKGGGTHDCWGQGLPHDI